MIDRAATSDTLRTLVCALAVTFMALCAPVSAQGLAVTDAWARGGFTKGGAGAAYAMVKNPGKAADKLIGAKSSAADVVELHTHVLQGQVMSMRKVDSIPVPAGGTVDLVPGGYHVMLMGLKQPLADGAKVPLTLVFEKAGEIKIEVTVRQPLQGRTPRGSSS
jgi:hypothetical protein